MTYHIGDIVTGSVTGVQPYGVFVVLANNQRGLIHISEVSHNYVSDLNYRFHVGDEVRAEIIDIDEYNDKISLSIRAMSDDPNAVSRRHKKHYWTDNHIKTNFQPIADNLDDWVKEDLQYLREKNL